MVFRPESVISGAGAIDLPPPSMGARKPFVRGKTLGKLLVVLVAVALISAAVWYYVMKILYAKGGKRATKYATIEWLTQMPGKPDDATLKSVTDETAGDTTSAAARDAFYVWLSEQPIGWPSMGRSGLAFAWRLYSGDAANMAMKDWLAKKPAAPSLLAAPALPETDTEAKKSARAWWAWFGRMNEKGALTPIAYGRYRGRR